MRLFGNNEVGNKQSENDEQRKREEEREKRHKDEMVMKKYDSIIEFAKENKWFSLTKEKDEDGYPSESFF